MNDTAGAEDAALHDIGHGDRTQEQVNLVAEFLPQIVGQATRLAAGAAGWRTRRTARCADRLIDRIDDVGDARFGRRVRQQIRSEEHTSELQSLMRISYAVFCLKKKKHKQNKQPHYKKDTTRNTST